MLLALLLLVLAPTKVYLNLYPQESEFREVKELGGLWWFVREPLNSVGYGFSNRWCSRRIETFSNATKLPVPSAYNDVTQDVELRDHVGWVWYQKEFFVPKRWNDANIRVVLRFASVNYYAAVFLNGKQLMTHTGGHLPFEADISEQLNFSTSNKVTVAVNNTLTHRTIPHGDFEYLNDTNRYAKGFFKQRGEFDFFNYAGILRPVVLCTRPNTYIEDIRVKADMTGAVKYWVKAEGNVGTNCSVNARLFEKHSQQAVQQKTSACGAIGHLFVNNPMLWWPRGTNHNSTAYLYEFEVQLLINSREKDVYRLHIGFRSIEVTDTDILINKRPFYCHGFGMHEDSEIRGRGFDWVIMAKDFSLIEWLNANCFRTSHYPYSEERYLEADRRGIAIISETPACAIGYFTKENLLLHQQMLEAMIQRDKNHPSVIMWSIANEPKNYLKSSRSYFKSLIDHAHQLDDRPVTIASSSKFDADQTGDLLDVICINRYYGWYINTGYISTIQKNLMYDLMEWNKRFNKPMMLTEYGAGSIPGDNYDPPMDFSEAYQVQVMLEYFKVFDELRRKFLTGELVWNFVDFMTSQGVTRVGGNRKGMFTRNRQPKMAAYELRRRYWHLDKCYIENIWQTQPRCYTGVF